MSAWRIGVERSRPSLAAATTGGIKEYADRLIKYIPGDAVAGYTTVITLFTLKDGVPDPQLWLVILFLAVTVALVLLGWASTPPADPGASRPSPAPDIVLAVIAFIAWSLVVPGNGWLDIEQITDNPEVAGVVGVVVGILMPGVAKLFGR